MAGLENESESDASSAQFRQRFRGYDRAAVDAHVAQLRREIERRDAELVAATAARDELCETVERLRAEVAAASDAAARASHSARVFDHMVAIALEAAQGVMADARLVAADLVAEARTAGVADGAPGDLPAIPLEVADEPETATVLSGLCDTGPEAASVESIEEDEADSSGLHFQQPVPAPLRITHSAAMELFDERSADEHWTSFTESDAGKAFFADESVDARARRWMLAG